MYIGLKRIFHGRVEYSKDVPATMFSELWKLSNDLEKAELLRHLLSRLSISRLALITRLNVFFFRIVSPLTTSPLKMLLWKYLSESSSPTPRLCLFTNVTAKLDCRQKLRCSVATV